MTTQVPIKDSHRPSQTEFGFWLYLMSDAILFGLLFATFVVMAHNTAGGPSGADLFSLGNLSMETALLLTSTLTIALGHQATVHKKTQTAIFWIVLTCVLGGGFVLLELTELTDMVQKGAGPERSGFLSAVFTLVGTHGLHVTAGILWALTMIVQLVFKGPTAAVASRLLRLTLFWHFLDIVWIGVFSVVYLPGVMG
ncbi:MAG: cytochrome c oxidase subunit 3 [Marinosulfonomonas sp.]